MFPSEQCPDWRTPSWWTTTRLLCLRSITTTSINNNSSSNNRRRRRHLPTRRTNLVLSFPRAPAGPCSSRTCITPLGLVSLQPHVVVPVLPAHSALRSFKHWTFVSYCCSQSLYLTTVLWSSCIIVSWILKAHLWLISNWIGWES